MSNTIPVGFAMIIDWQDLIETALEIMPEYFRNFPEEGKERLVSLAYWSAWPWQKEYCEMEVSLIDLEDHSRSGNLQWLIEEDCAMVCLATGEVAVEHPEYNRVYTYYSAQDVLVFKLIELGAIELHPQCATILIKLHPGYFS